MKTILLLYLVAVPCFAQNILVNFYPANQPLNGLTNWPSGTKLVSFSTNSPGWQTNMTIAQYSSYLSSRQPLYDSALSNFQWSASSNVSSNYTAWSNMYVQIPQGITDSSNRFNTFTNMAAVMTSLRSSWQSGTNTASGTNVIISRLFTNMVLWAQQDQVGWTYLNQVIVYLSRLGPGLQQVYKPESDPVGH